MRESSFGKWIPFPFSRTLSFSRIPSLSSGYPLFRRIGILSKERVFSNGETPRRIPRQNKSSKNDFLNIFYKELGWKRQGFLPSEQHSQRLRLVGNVIEPTLCSDSSDMWVTLRNSRGVLGQFSASGLCWESTSLQATSRTSKQKKQQASKQAI